MTLGLSFHSFKRGITRSTSEDHLKVRVVTFNINAPQRAWCQCSVHAGGCCGSMFVSYPSFRMLAIIICFFLGKETCYPESHSRHLGHNFWWWLCLSASCHLNSVCIFVLPSVFLSGLASSLKTCLPKEVKALLWIGLQLCRGLFRPETNQKILCQNITVVWISSHLDPSWMWPRWES